MKLVSHQALLVTKVASIALLLLLSALWLTPCGAAQPRDRENESLPYHYLYLADFSRLRHEAELGKIDALFQLGLMHYDPPENSGIKQSYRRAFSLFFEASLRGHATSQHNVGAMYWNGDYVSQNVVEGYAWFELAALAGDTAARRKFKLHEADLTDSQRDDAHKRMAELQALLAKAKTSRSFDPRDYGIH